MNITIFSSKHVSKLENIINDIISSMNLDILSKPFDEVKNNKSDKTIRIPHSEICDTLPITDIDTIIFKDFMFRLIYCYGFALVVVASIAMIDKIFNIV